MESWDEVTAPAPEMPEIKLFGKWSPDDVQVNDISLTVSVCWFFLLLFFFFYMSSILGEGKIKNLL